MSETELAPRADSDAALLAKYDFADLPAQFAMRDNANGIIQEKAPCYLCVADGFYGQGKSGTWYEEGSIIVMDGTPNNHTKPLNRAAAVKWAKWAESLPRTRVHFDIGDMAEAATILAKNPKVQELDPIAYQDALIQMCERIKLRREGKDARDLPGLGHNFAPASGGSNASPILNAKMSDLAQRGPGTLHEGAAKQAGGVRRAGAGSPAASGNALGGPPPQR